LSNIVHRFVNMLFIHTKVAHRETACSYRYLHPFTSKKKNKTWAKISWYASSWAEQQA